MLQISLRLALLEIVTDMFLTKVVINVMLGYTFIMGISFVLDFRGVFEKKNHSNHFSCIY